MTQPKWTQEEAIAYECARECITDLMGICSSQIAAEEGRPTPDALRLSQLEEQLTALARERTSLTVKSHDEITRIRRDYGARIRAHRAQPSVS